MFLDFSELSSRFFSITNIVAEKQTCTGKTTFTMHQPRPTDAFLLFANTTGICYQNGLPPLYIPQGALVYIPRNSRYMWENSPAEDDIQENFLFEFTLNHIDVFRKNTPEKEIMRQHDIGEDIIFGEKVTIVTTRHLSLYKHLFGNLLNSFNEENVPFLSVYCDAYNIFNAVANSCILERKNSNGMQLIKDSIKYLTENEKSIKEIAGIYHISVSYYERLFREYAGISPTKYRQIQIINNIKMHLQNNRTTLDEIAEKMNYCDSGYLCRFFKKETGMTPKEYRRIYTAQIQKP